TTLTMWQQYFLLLRIAFVVCIVLSIFVSPILITAFFNEAQMGFLVHLLNRINDLPIISLIVMVPLTLFFLTSQYLEKQYQRKIWLHVLLSFTCVLISFLLWHFVTGGPSQMVC